MAQYGEYLNVLNPRDEVYQIVDNFFDRPVLTKTGDEGDFSLYMCKIHSLLALEKRFLVAILPLDNFPPGFQVPLADLKWVSFHITKLEHPPNNVRFIPHRYVVKRAAEYQRRISLFNRDSEASYYDVDLLPIVVTLQHGKKSPYSFQKEGTLLLAMETFSTILTFK